jgi:hypothetical protein
LPTAALEGELSSLQDQQASLSAAAEVEAKESERTQRLQDDLDRLDAGARQSSAVLNSGMCML